MGRRTETARQADKLDQAAADAAALMSANIAKIGGQIVWKSAYPPSREAFEQWKAETRAKEPQPRSADPEKR